MKIAVLMSTYNGKDYLKEQLDSLAAQSLSDSIHLYVRDDGSRDTTINILESYNNQIAMTIITGKNIGPAKSFWELLISKEIQADYYAFCDQDDVWDPNKLEAGIKQLEESQEMHLWCSNCRVIDSNGNIIDFLYHKEEPYLTVPSQFVCGSIQGCAMIFDDEYRKYIINKGINMFPMHDFVLITYAMANKCFIYDSEPYFSYRIHERNAVAHKKKRGLSDKLVSVKRWFAKEHRHELTEYARFFASDNTECLSENDRVFLEHLCGSRTNVFDRIAILMSPLCIARNKRALRSFKIRVLLGII